MLLSRLFAVTACAAAASGAAIAQLTPAPSSVRLYENIDVLGVLDCEIKGDVRLLAGGDKRLRCEYRPRGLPDVIHGYALSIRTMQQGFFSQEADFLCWNVLYLRDRPLTPNHAGSIAGAYAAALQSVAEAYGLKENSLVGGLSKSYALEPRCEAERAGRNIADAMRAVELSD